VQRGRHNGRCVALWKQRRRKVHTREVNPIQIRFAQNRHAHIRARKLRTFNIRGTEVGIAQIRAPEIRVAQISSEKLYAAGLRFA
jgi:hypothetical protein